MSELTEQMCMEAALVASSPSLRLLYALRMILGAIGFVCVLFLWITKGCSWIPNKNAKILYQAHMYFSLHISFFFTLMYGFQFIRSLLYSPDPCFYVFDARISALIRMAPGLGIHLQTFNMFTLTIERAISTLCPRRYEKIDNPLFGIVLLLLSMVVVVVMNLFCVYLPIQPHSYVSLLTARNNNNVETYQIINNVPLVVELTTILVFAFTYYVNNRKEAVLKFRKVTLGNRYQIAENQKIIRTLLPCFSAHCLLNLFSYGGLSLYSFIFPQFDIVSATVWIEIISTAQIYPIILLLTIYWQTRNKRQGAIYSSDVATDMYFQKLNELFDRIE